MPCSRPAKSSTCSRTARSADDLRRRAAREGAAGAAASGVDVLTVMSPDGGDLPRLEAEAAAAEPIRSYEPCRPSDTATILYTSGTTGKPKGALGTHFALVEQTSVILTSVMDFKPGDVLFGGLPLFHTFGQTVVLNAGLRAGATVVLMPRFSGEGALALLDRHQVNIFVGVPTMYVALLEAAKSTDVRPDALRYGISGGASLPLAVMDKFREVFGVEIHEGYGLTETSPVAAFNHVGMTPRPVRSAFPSGAWTSRSRGRKRWSASNCCPTANSANWWSGATCS